MARDMIFLAFAESGHTVGHESHIEIMRSINRMISHAHIITSFRVILYIFALKTPSSNPTLHPLDAIEDFEFKKIIHRHINDAYQAVIWLMIHRSIILLIASIFAKMRWKIKRLSERWELSISSAVDSIVASAEQEELIASTPHRAVRVWPSKMAICAKTFPAPPSYFPTPSPAASRPAQRVL